MTKLARRSFLGGVCAAAVIGFDPVRRSWITSAAAAPLPTGLSQVPPLDGQLLSDPASLAAAADDFGHTIQQQPIAVLRPGSVDDVVKMVRYARDNRLSIAARGQGHSTFGQSQVDAGIVIDSSTLSTVHEVCAHGALVDVGARWRQIVDASLPQGLAPPTMTDYLDLSVGGTLSGAGVGGAAHRHGAQIDNVLELDVVTGNGDLCRCSYTENPLLFNSVLGGLGQFAIIVRARIRLIPVLPIARIFALGYTDLSTLLVDLGKVAFDQRFDHVQAQAAPLPAGGFGWQLVAASYTAGAPDDATLLAGLSFDPGSQQLVQIPYAAFLARIDPIIQAQINAGVWTNPHPWLDLFIPCSSAKTYVSSALAELSPASLGGGPILLYPLRRSKLHRPFFRVPQEELFFLFDVLRTAPRDATVVQAEIASNRSLYDRARAVGGTRYCIGSIPFSFADWQAHFGTSYGDLVIAKSAFDPHRILTPGQGIFGHGPG